MLYLLNDLLHHAQARINDVSVAGKFQPVLVALFSSAASFTNLLKHQRKLQDLLDIWNNNNYYSEEYIRKLRESIRSAANGDIFIDGATLTDMKNGSSRTKAVPYVMPAVHGDLSTPWYDLPAGNIMPYIVPNSTRPINPKLIKPLRFMAGPADDKLAVAVKDLLKDVDAIFGVVDIDKQTDESNFDIDELGQPIIRDEIIGDVLEAEGYYGWSRHFCERMKQRKKGINLREYLCKLLLW